jgi:hypothetical protein
MKPPRISVSNTKIRYTFIQTIFGEKKTKIVGKDGCLKKKVENFQSFKRGHKPSPWFFSAIPNTIMGSVLKTSFSHNYEK